MAFTSLPSTLHEASSQVSAQIQALLKTLRMFCVTCNYKCQAAKIAESVPSSPYKKEILAVLLQCIVSSRNNNNRLKEVGESIFVTVCVFFAYCSRERKNVEKCSKSCDTCQILMQNIYGSTTCKHAIMVQSSKHAEVFTNTICMQAGVRAATGHDQYTYVSSCIQAKGIPRQSVPNVDFLGDIRRRTWNDRFDDPALGISAHAR